MGFPCGSAGEESACNAGDLGLIPGLGRSPGEGKGSPLQYSGLENSMDHTTERPSRSLFALDLKKRKEQLSQTVVPTGLIHQNTACHHPEGEGLFSRRHAFFFFPPVRVTNLAL